MITRIAKSGHHPDYFLMALVLFLTICGLVILASASSELGKLKFDDPYYYIKHQIIYGLSVGIVGFIVGIKLHYQIWKKIALALFLLNIVLLILIFAGFGRTAGGSSRWLQFGPIIFQPSELLKISFIIYLAAWLSNAKTNRTKDFWSGLLPFLIICGITTGLLFAQPATSTVAILLSAGLIVYFLSGVPLRYIFVIGLLAVLAFGILIRSTPYRWQRIVNFLNPESDVLGFGYQREQTLIAIGSGGIWGMGYGKSTSKATTLPTPIDDSIFAVAAQEIGFAGASTLIILFGLIVFRLFWLAKNIRDPFGHLILSGFGSIIAMQSLVNMAAISGFIPMTGVPLPFISYGGTALAVFLTISGISLNISKYTS